MPASIAPSAPHQIAGVAVPRPVGRRECARDVREVPSRLRGNAAEYPPDVPPVSMKPGITIMVEASTTASLTTIGPDGRDLGAVDQQCRRGGSC
jgi:hypothetical protein